MAGRNDQISRLFRPLSYKIAVWLLSYSGTEIKLKTADTKSSWLTQPGFLADTADVFYTAVMILERI